MTFCRREANKPLSCCTRFKHTVGAGPTPLAPTPPPPPSSESSVSSACQNRCTRDPPPPPRRDPASGPRSDPPATFLSTRPCFSSKIPLKRAHARPWSPPRPETEGGAAPLCFILRDPHHGSAVLNTTSPPLLIPPSPSPLHPFTPSSLHPRGEAVVRDSRRFERAAWFACGSGGFGACRVGLVAKRTRIGRSVPPLPPGSELG